MKCPNCDKECEEFRECCPHCGKSTKAPEPPPPATSGPPGVSGGSKPDEEKPEQVRFKLSDHMGRTTMVLIVIAVLAVAGWVLAAIFIGTGNISDETSVETATERLIEYVTDGDYDSILRAIDMSDPQLLGILISETTERSPQEIVIYQPDVELVSSRIAGEFIRSYFPTLKTSLAKSNIDYLDSQKLSDGQYLVAVHSFDRPEPFPLIMIKSGDTWKLDLNAMLVMDNDGQTSRYVTDSVRALLAEPNKENASKAVAIMDSVISLDQKYDLWLEPAAKALLPVEVANGISRGKKLISGFPDLREEAEAALEEVSGSKEPSTEPEPEPTPIPPEMVTIEGEGSQVTDKFDLKQGLATIHFDHEREGRFRLTILDSEEQPLGQVADYYGEISGSQAVGLAEGTYALKVETRGPWTVGVEEPTPAQAPYPPQSFNGEGPVATPFFQTKGGPVSFKMEHGGNSGFVVTVIELGGNAAALMANASGPFQASKLVSLKAGIFYLLNVEATGPWAITIE